MSEASFLDAIFRPLPLLGNPHVQTLLGHFLPGERFDHPSRDHVVPLPDGDALLVHDTVPAGWRPGGRVAVLIHGLSGTARSAMIIRLAARLLALGMRTVRINLRGAGKGIPLA